MSNIQYSKHELRPQKVQLLNEKSSALKTYIKVSDALWDALINNHVLSQFEVMEFQVSYKINCVTIHFTYKYSLQ